MPTLGEELRHKREQRGISLAEISEATRIGTRFLKAIETDNFSILPGGIFTRSFIRAYAKHVGMNEDEAVGLYLQQVAGPTAEQQEAAGQPPAEQAPAEQSTKRPAPPKLVLQKPAPAAERSRRFEPVTFRQSPSRTSWPTIVIGAGIVIFIVIIVIALIKQLNQGAGESESQSASIAQKNAPPKPALPPSSRPAPQPSTPSPGAPAEQPSAAPSEVPAGQPLVVKLEAATGDVWIKYQVDDAKPTTLVLRQGQSQDLPPAQTHVTLNYGNRLTLKLKINNREANFPPDTPKFASQVIISRDNFQTFFQ
jgi:cytoskeletal protein RodZ